MLAERPDGTRTVISPRTTRTSNKAHKGRLARLLAGTRAEPADAAAVARLLRRAGLRVERSGRQLDVVVPA